MSNAQRITAALKGKWHGYYGLAFCPAHANTRTPALSLKDGEGGRLLAWCHVGCDYKSILGAMHGLGLIEGQGRYSAPSSAAMAAIKLAKQAEARRREVQARALWLEGLPIHGTPAEVYLRGRGITADLPESLRFHPEAWHTPSAMRRPAMLALVEGARGLALHRTYLRPDGQGKAPVDPSKMMLGPTSGGAVRLHHRPGPLVVAEGVETALSLVSGILREPVMVWATLSAAGMAALSLPPLAQSLIIATDGDSVGREAGDKLAERARALGWTVSLMPAPDGRDWNDILSTDRA